VFQEDRNPLNGQPPVTRNFGGAFLDSSHVATECGPLWFCGNLSKGVERVFGPEHQRTSVKENLSSVAWPNAEVAARYHYLTLRCARALLWMRVESSGGQKVFVLKSLSRQEHGLQRGN
jgi:hypothetical protein